MAHFAKLDGENRVIQVEVVSNDIAATEQAGVDFLNNLYGTNDVWKQTSYNTIGGIHQLGGTPFRKNYAQPGYQYDEIRDAFIPPKPYNSWTLNEDSCNWISPVERPADVDNFYVWNEENQNWEVLIIE